MDFKDWRTVSILALAGGLITLLSVFYFTEHLSFAIGFYYGISSTVNAYNITPSAGIVSLISQVSAISLALSLVYIMFPFSIVMTAIGVLWIFSKSYLKLTSAALVFCAIAYMALASVLALNFSSPTISVFDYLPYIGGILALAAGALGLLSMSQKQVQKRSASPIQINPETPYSNMLIISNRLMKKLSGNIRILDMHIDSRAIENLARLVSGNAGSYKKISVLTTKERLGDDFARAYNDFKAELANQNVEFELRIIKESEAHRQHERMILDDSKAYKIPPLNIINRKNEHIVSIKHKDAEMWFERLWGGSTRFENAA
ncbi:MAG TPA: hypothetical protein VND15_00255 [Candidatus Acidoferrales bacterium]|nr:hypothetical protein [Candidatus Acidoferrales bacterium]